ncbi:hypothetical protein [Nocardiopsis dassonvillei]|uniref:hypothetical protein n=1 Tax=Nocardiopsis dassonvillei TaxID=2014 RepID=UPI003F55F094
MAKGEKNSMERRSFLSCATETARLPDIEDVAVQPDSRRARRLAHAVRKALLERAHLPEDLFTPLMTAAVYDPDPSFCHWFVEPAVYVFGRRRVMSALVDYLRTGTDTERAGAVRAWYCAHLPLRADRSPAYGPNGVRDHTLDESQDIRAAWLKTSMQVFAETADPRTRQSRHHTRHETETRFRLPLGGPATQRSEPTQRICLLASAVGLKATSEDAHAR